MVLPLVLKPPLHCLSLLNSGLLQELQLLPAAPGMSLVPPLLTLRRPSGEKNNAGSKAKLAAFAEPRFLHFWLCQDCYWELNKPTNVTAHHSRETGANFCSLHLCKILSALCTSNTNLAQEQHTEKMSAVQAVLQSAALRHLRSVGVGKRMFLFLSIPC